MTGQVRSQATVAVVPQTCASCRGVIPAGQTHLRHTDWRRRPVVRFLECDVCARRAGRGPLVDRRPPA